MRFRHHRYPARFPVTVDVDGQQTRCQVSNINEAGARLAGLADQVRGKDVTLVLSIGRVRGVVQWVTKDQVGIAFRPKIPLNFVDAMRHGFARTKAKGNFGHGLRELR